MSGLPLVVSRPKMLEKPLVVSGLRTWIVSDQVVDVA